MHNIAGCGELTAAFCCIFEWDIQKNDKDFQRISIQSILP